MQAAFNAFLSAGAHDVVREIQKGNVAQPRDVVAAAVHAAVARAASADGGAAQPPAEPVHDWLLADRAVQEAATSGQIKVGALGGWGLRARRPSGAVGLPGLAAYLK